MATSLLFSPDIMSPYINAATGTKQPLPKSITGLHINSFKGTSVGELTHWSSQQHHSQRSATHHLRLMSNDNHNTFSAATQVSDDLLSEYTIDTHPPHPNDDYGLWLPAPTNSFQPELGPLSIQTSSSHSRVSSSPFQTDSHWTDLSYNGPNEQTSNNSGIIFRHDYAPDPSANTLSPYSAHPRTPSSLPHLSPTMSDQALSPSYSASPRLPTPSTPGSVSQSFIGSPLLGDMNSNNNMLALEPQTLTGHPERPRFTHREQLLKFRDALNLPMDGAGPFIPQQMYKPHTTSDRKRYVEEVLLEGPLYFACEHPQQYGISLRDALHSRTKRLRDRDQVVFEGRGPSVSIRLEWPGYRQWSRQIPTKDFRSPPQPITLAKLAKNVAKCVQRFMQDRKSLPMEEEADSRWTIGDGPDDIKLEDLILVSIHHVSLGSWQPHLRLARPLRPRHGHAVTMLPTPVTASSATSSNAPFSILS